MSDDLVSAVSATLDAGADADDILRSVVGVIAERPGIFWAGVAFVEDGALSLGPTAGLPNESARLRTHVRYQGDAIAELWVDGDADAQGLEDVAALIAEVCLVGWDTGGEPWDPAA